MVARAAAMATGFPPKVEACEPGTQSMISARVMSAQSGRPLAMPLATVIMSGATPECSMAHHLPVRPMPDCTSSTTSRMPCLSQMRRSSCRKTAGAGQYPPSPWMASTTMAAHSFGRNFGAEDLLLDVARGVAGVLLGLGAGGPAIEVGIADVDDSGHQRREAAALLRLGAGERKRAHGASVEGAVEGDDVLALGVIARELERGLDGLGAGVAVVERDAGRAWARSCERRAASGELRVVEVGAGHVNQFAGLLLDGGDDLGMAVSGGGDGDSGGEVEELIAVHVLDHDAASALGDQWIGAGVGRRNDFGVCFENALGIRAGQSCANLGPGLVAVVDMESSPIG